MKALVLVIIVTAAVQGQSTQPYRTGTRVVEITIAADADGHKPVTDLRPTDLRVFDNGKQQTIASLAKLQAGGTGSDASHAKSPNGPPKRLSIIVLDALNTPWSDQLYGGDGVCQVFGNLPPSNRVAVFALDSGLHLLHDFSNDYESLRASVERYETQPISNWVRNWPFYPALYRAKITDSLTVGPDAAFEGIGPNGIVGSPMPTIFDESTAIGFADTNRILYTLQALTRIADLTRSYPGPKSILWISAGFPTQLATYNDGVAVPEFFHQDVAQAMQELGIDNAVLYPISPEGLDWSHVESMKEMAEQTGGRVFYGSNDVQSLVRGAMNDMSEGYALTFVPKNYIADGSLHQLRIETTRKGVALRYREVYVGDSQNASIRYLPSSAARSKPPAVTQVANSGDGVAIIAPNSWIQIDGSNLAPADDARIWQGSDFENSQLPTQLDGVGVTMNGKNAYVYFISPAQVKVLTPPDLAPGPVQIKVTRGGAASAYFTAQAKDSSPAFFTLGHGVYVMGTHADGSNLGPTNLYPGRTSPASRGELIVLFGNGFGPIAPPVVAGSKVQSGPLPSLPLIKIGGVPAQVHLAGLASPGVYQFDVVVPVAAPHGDDEITAAYNGRTTQPGLKIAIQ